MERRMQDRAYEIFERRIRRSVPRRHIKKDLISRLAWGTDAGFYHLVPRLVVIVGSVQEVQAVLAAALETGVSITFRASGTSLSGQAVTDSVIVQLSGDWAGWAVSDDRRTVTLDPAIRAGKINAILARYGKCFAPDPASVHFASVGGIVMNNASGMSCGTHANSDRMLRSVRIVLPDGTVLDTGSEESREAFRATHAAFLESILRMRDRVQSDRELYERIVRKYAVKNVVGLNLLPFAEEQDPFRIITRLMAGSEGTLAFLSSATFDTSDLLPCKATAMLYSRDLPSLCGLLPRLRELPVHCAELLDTKSLQSVAELLPAGVQEKLTGSPLCALLLETRAANPETLDRKTALLEKALEDFSAEFPFVFTREKREQAVLWSIRSGIFPSIGGTRNPGSTSLIEDLAVPVESLAEAVADLRELLESFGYDEAAIYGHVLDGNIHIVLNQTFNTPIETERYKRLMDGMADLVVKRFGGSLKAEHGTGRNIAPYVGYEWGGEALRLMREIKQLFDPGNILNRGVIFNDDPSCHIDNLKKLPVLGDETDRCIECGFCEPSCATLGYTLSPRQRVVIRRAIADPATPTRIVRDLRKSYRYSGTGSCASDGLCALACPMQIDMSDVTRRLREENLARSPRQRWALKQAGLRFEALREIIRAGLGGLQLFYRMAGETITRGTLAFARWMTAGMVPRWSAAFPKPWRMSGVPQQTVDERPAVVYFPSCINRTMGNAMDDAHPDTVVDTTIRLLEKAGYRVLFPENLEALCCGMIWSSKGDAATAALKSAALAEALRTASRDGRYPVLCDQSPCLYHMRETISGMEMYEPVEFIWKFLRDRLVFEQTDRFVALHPTCSTRKMGLEQTLYDVASLCARQIMVPDEASCCGFAGDKGFFDPDLNAHALRHLRKTVSESGAEAGFSNSRTCEIGLTTHSGIDYRNIVFLVDAQTKPYHP